MKMCQRCEEILIDYSRVNLLWDHECKVPLTIEEQEEIYQKIKKLINREYDK